MKTTLLALAIWALALPAAAQRLPQSQARVYLAGDGLFQALFEPFNRSSSFDLFHETGTFTVLYPPGKSPAYAGTVVVRVWRIISIGATVTRVQTTTDATLQGEIPHPFFFDQPRLIEGSAPGIARDERGAHVQFRLVVPVNRRLDVSVFAGPSRWDVRQERITSLDYESEYPFDTARFSRAVIEQANAVTWGFNAGIDASVYFSRNVGVGALLLIATANPATEVTATTADTRIGGMRAGGGLRLRF